MCQSSSKGQSTNGSLLSQSSMVLFFPSPIHPHAPINEPMLYLHVRLTCSWYQTDFISLLSLSWSTSVWKGSFEMSCSMLLLSIQGRDKLLWSVFISRVYSIHPQCVYPSTFLDANCFALALSNADSYAARS